MTVPWDWLAAILPPEIGAGLFAALLAASFATSLITAAFGIGGGVVLMAILASLMPPAALIPVHGVVQLGSNAARSLLLIRHVHWSVLPAFALGSLGGALVGGAVAVELSPNLVQAGVGVFVIWSVFARPPAWLMSRAWMTGGITTFLTMFFGATGMFVATYVKGLGLGRHGHVATHSVLMTCQHLLKVAVFGLFGFAFVPWIGLVVGMIGAGVLGTIAGRAILTRLTDAHFRRVLDVILVLIALRLIWSGVTGG